MQVDKFGIVLRRVESADIEMLRMWRNSDFVKQFMVYQDYITPEMQQAWFNKIDNIYNFFFIIENNNEPVGLANIKDIDYLHSTGESGIYLINEQLTQSDIATRAALALLEYGFDVIELKKIYQTILDNNSNAVNFNKYLGVKIISHENGIYKTYLEPNDFRKSTQKIVQYLNKIYHD